MTFSESGFKLQDEMICGHAVEPPNARQIHSQTVLHCAKLTHRLMIMFVVSE